MPEKKDGIDSKTVDQIVEKMKKKYQSEGTEFNASETGLNELHQLITDGPDKAIKVQNVEELAETKAPWIRALGKIYLKLRNPLRPLVRFIATLPQAQTLNFYLYAANMRYSLSQYIVLTTSTTIIAAFFGLLFGILASFVISTNIWLSALIVIFSTLFFGLLAAYITLTMPRRNAETRGNECDAELPFALRHMATELKSGIGLYRTIQIIATADYGILSEEFARTITEIEQGTDAQEALRTMANRVQSKALRNALLHMVRAMKTGGNLSDVMSDIAQDVAIEQQNKIREFAEKINFFGVIFIFCVIVLPSMFVTLGGIKAAPLPQQINIPITAPVIAGLFFIIMPIVLAVFITYLRNTQPRV